MKAFIKIVGYIVSIILHYVKSVQIRSFFWSIFPLDWIQENRNQKKVRIWTLFTLCKIIATFSAWRLVWLLGSLMDIMMDVLIQWCSFNRRSLNGDNSTINGKFSQKFPFQQGSQKIRFYKIWIFWGFENIFESYSCFPLK